MTDQPVTDAGRRAVDAIKGGALVLWADDPGDPIAAMIADVERAARTSVRCRDLPYDAHDWNNAGSPSFCGDCQMIFPRFSALASRDE